MKVLLVSSFPYQVICDAAEPLNLCYIAAFLRSKGHPTEIFQMLEYDKRQINHFLNERVRQFDLIGFSTYTANYRSAKWLTKIIKEKYPQKYVVWGGPFITTLPKLLDDSGADFAVRGEGEQVLLKLIEYLENNKSDFSEIKGLIYRSEEGVSINPPMPRITNLDELPFAYRDGLPYEKYKIMYSSAFFLEPTTSEYGIYSSRGCINACRYCASAAVWRREWHARSPENVIEEMRYLKERFGANLVLFPDADFCMDRERVVNFCEKLKASSLNMKWVCQTSPYNLDKELIKVMKDGNCMGIAGLGIESGAPEILQNACSQSKIKFGPEEVLDLVKSIVESGMICLANFIVGLPWESKQTLKATRKFLRRLEADTISIAFARPYPGTVIYKIAVQNGWIKAQFSDQITFLTFPSLPTFYLTKWQVWKGMWGNILAFYFSPRFLRYVWKRSKQQPFKSNLSTFFKLLKGVADGGRLYIKALIWDVKKLLAQAFGVSSSGFSL